MLFIKNFVLTCGLIFAFGLFLGFFAFIAPILFDLFLICLIECLGFGLLLLNVVI